MTGQVMTVTGPIASADLGVTDAHDHLLLRSPALRGDEMDDPERAINEVREAKTSGLQAIVELTPIGLGRRPDVLRLVSESTGMLIIGATGYHRDAHYPADHWVNSAGEDLLLDRMLADIERGMHPQDWTDDSVALDTARAGVIKAGASYHRVSRGERRRLAAIGEASQRTGVPIVAHTEVGTGADEIVSTLTAAGATEDRVILAHLDRNPDAELHIEFAARGVYLEYDTVGRIKYRPDSQLIDLIEAVCAAGYLGQIMLGLDLGRSSYFRAYEGGPGMRYLMAAFVPRLRKRIGESAVRQILVDNPARAFTIR
jgi:phosphotriesterase-related protein